jgi:hypothetical protein
MLSGASGGCLQAVVQHKKPRQIAVVHWAPVCPVHAKLASTKAHWLSNSQVLAEAGPQTLTLPQAMRIDIAGESSAGCRVAFCPGLSHKHTFHTSQTPGALVLHFIAVVCVFAAACMYAQPYLAGSTIIARLLAATVCNRFPVGRQLHTRHTCFKRHSVLSWLWWVVEHS